MKKRLIFLIVFCAVSANADDLTLRDGTVYRNVTIISSDPVQMLIAHDGGGCQIRFDALVPDSLTAEQRAKVETGLKEYAERQARLEKLRIERETFELAQQAKGLVKFEDAWMTPLEREQLIAKREQQRLEIERRRLELATEQAQLRKEKLEAEKAARELEEQWRRSRYITYSYFDCPPVRPNSCARPVPYNQYYSAPGSLSGYSRSSGFSISIGSGNSSFSRSVSPFPCK